MPLCVDASMPAGTSDEQWLRAQFCFKGKPSFIIEGAAGPRNINGFGPVHPLAATRTQSIDACHFVHTSVSDGSTHFHNLWAQCDDADRRTDDLSMLLNTFPREAAKPLQFLEELTIERSIFRDTEPTGTSMVDAFLFAPDRWVNIPLLNTAIQTMTKSTFAGCVDCNSKMTQMGKVPAFFSESFPSVRNVSLVRVEYRDNAMMNYLLLQGMLRVDNVFGPPDAANVRAPFQTPLGYQSIWISPAQQRTWKMKLGVMWCYFSIFMSNHSLSRLKPPFAHHSAYIFLGTSDFYLSMVLYIIYVANIPRDMLVTPLLFEEFHYFYAKNIPFYLRHRGKLGTRTPTAPYFSNSLTNAILGADASRDNGFAWMEAPAGLGLDSPNDRHLFRDAQVFIGQIHASLCRFVVRHFNPLCGELYHARASPDLVLDYFARTDRVSDLLRQSNHAAMTIQAYVTLLGPDRYWFHFKAITMAQIARDLAISREHYAVADASSAIIDNWAHLALGTARALSSEGRALGVRRTTRV